MTENEGKHNRSTHAIILQDDNSADALMERGSLGKIDGLYFDQVQLRCGTRRKPVSREMCLNSTLLEALNYSLTAAAFQQG